jgi:diacylglycerol kinase (ATP)
MHFPKQKIVFIINPKAGITPKFEAFMKLMIERLFQNSLYECKLAFTRYAGHAIEIAKDAIEDKVDYVVATGGDGTINEVARALFKSNVAMGILPTGSGNGLARHLGISMNLVKALKTIREGKVKSIDTAFVNGHLCTSIAGIGFDAIVAKRFSNTPVRGFMTYASIGIRLFRTYQPKKYAVIIDGVPVQTSALMINMANSNQFGFNVKIAPHALIDDGFIDICITSKPSMLRMCLASPRLFMGNWDKTAYTRYYKGQEVLIPNTKGELVNIDGESFQLPNDFHMHMNPKSLKIVVPATSIS